MPEEIKNKNAQRKHFVQAFVPGENEPGEEWLALAGGIENISPANEEETESKAFYSGDGTPETIVTSVARGYTATGERWIGNPAQDFIESIQDEIGDGRKLWHKVVRSDQKKEWVGLATASDIDAGSGDAQTIEEFACTIRFNQRPEMTEIDENGGGSGE